MILETHGDVCRLGYLRVIACLLEDRQPKSFDFLAGILYEMMRSVGNEETPQTIGLITRSVNARNYVTLAAEMEIIDRSSQTLGRFGRIYLALRSSDRIRDYVEGRAIPSVRELISLNEAEQFFFMWNIMVADYPFIQYVVSWVLERERFTRQEAMNYIMEEAYPEALRKILPSLPKKKREQVAKEVEEAEKFREKRIAIQDKTQWIRSSQYAKYRHIAPPRLEWLVDVGVLSRMGRGKYEVSQPYLQNADEVSRVMSMTPARMEENLYNTLSKLIYRNLRTANMYEISRTLIEGYEKIRDGDQVSLDTLKKVTFLLLMEGGKITDLRTIHDAFNRLALRFPDKIYVSPGEGKTINIAYMNLSEAEI